MDAMCMYFISSEDFCTHACDIHVADTDRSEFKSQSKQCGVACKSRGLQTAFPDVIVFGKALSSNLSGGESQRGSMAFLATSGKSISIALANSS